MASTTSKDASQQPPAADGKTFFGHPRGLATLFMTEMWERFSFYGMRALLVLYLTAAVAEGGMGMASATAVALYSVYNATVYLMAMPGGWLGDRVWGPRKTVSISAFVIMIGHALLATGVNALFFAGLVFIGVGSGLLKANISTMVGHLYAGPNDPRRDGGFTVFYMGINVGAFAAPLLIGWAGQKVSWHLGFGLAAVGMGLGLIQFLIGTRHLAPESSVVPQPLDATDRNKAIRNTVIAAVVTAIFYTAVVLADVFTIDWVLWPLSIAGLVLPTYYFVRMRRDREVTDDERKKLSGYIWFFVAAAIFWMIFDQSGSTLNLFAEKSTSTDLAGIEFPTSWFQSVNPLWVMIIAPLLAALWVKLGSRNPATTTKFSFGLIGIGVSFGVMMLAIASASGGDKVTPLWLITVYLLQTVAELCLSPVGLSVTTKLAPAKYASQLMGVWFLAVTAGDCVFAIIQLVLGDAASSTTGFAVQGVIAALAGFAFFAARKRVNPLLGDVK
ncbi:POT family proton-dependent oligopeptide transporter [Streptomyces sp. Amel2xB2]|uniref:peptide MFS transporter n=1 Tax=Streptomyces sp. Amel2xB2 TaxID=1305829 RepID=UPI000DBACD99|nr:oligopeptide:H+ symporter [Streptomyces sp. Amel2xB2]RAJ62584.1 POT family proton-dependent oligopeptide transporter [Streptomyces sp. Amel2xB2]